MASGAGMSKPLQGSAASALSFIARIWIEPVDADASRCVELGFHTVARVKHGDGDTTRGCSVCARMGCESCLQ